MSGIMGRTWYIITKKSRPTAERALRWEGLLQMYPTIERAREDLRALYVPSKRQEVCIAEVEVHEKGVCHDGTEDQ